MKKLFGILIFIGYLFPAFSQRVIYSEPNNNDTRQTNFEIIGKINGNIQVYKKLRDNHEMSIYNLDMKEIDRIKLDFVPDRIINSDFLAYPDYSLMFYQYQKKNVVYCMAAKIDDKGKIINEPVVLDTTEISFWASNRMYTVLNSEDKQKLLVFKINSKNEKNHLLTVSIFNKELKKMEKEYINIPMPERNDFLTEFQIDNEGNLYFARAVQNQSNDNISKLFLLSKNINSGLVNELEIPLKENYLDDIKIKIDNLNQSIILTSLYTKTRMGNNEGIFIYKFDRAKVSPQSMAFMEFGEDLRREARGDNSIKAAFNDYFIRNIITRKDGGFLLAAEAYYTTGRGGFNRNNYLYGSPYLRSSDYYMFNPYTYSFPWYRYNSFGQTTRYHAENVVVLAFGPTGNIEWTNVVNKSQFDDDTDGLIGYQMVNTGDALHFLFNLQERRTQILSAQSIMPDGQINRVPTLKNLDKGYDFMPAYGKQIGSRQIIFPCMYRNYLCFARLDL